jgi:hypothetical protein
MKVIWIGLMCISSAMAIGCSRSNHGCRVERVTAVHLEGMPGYIITLSDGRSYQRAVHDTETSGGNCGSGPCAFHVGDVAYVCPTRYKEEGGVEIVTDPGAMDYPNDFTYHAVGDQAPI